jgi:hypothetical protein
VVVIGAAGLIAAVEGLTTAGPQLVMNGPTVLDVAGTAAGLAGFVMIGIAYRAATRQHRRRVHLLGMPILLLMCQFLLVPAFNIGIITHASKPNIRPASSLGYAGAAFACTTTRLLGVRYGLQLPIAPSERHRQPPPT